MRIFCTSRIAWKRISDWLPIVFHFGTENWEDQLKKSTLYKLLLMTRDYVNKFKKTDASFETVIRNESFFREKFTQFLFSPKGASFQVIISDCDCGDDDTDNDGNGIDSSSDDDNVINLAFRMMISTLRSFSPINQR